MQRATRRKPAVVKSGFSIIEVMLVLGISGLMLMGLLVGTFSSISRQRYNDAVRSFAEQLRSVYNEVIRPDSLGFGNSGSAILGKVIVFDPNVTGDSGDRQFYTATIIGRANLNLNPVQPNSSLLEELASAESGLYCGIDDIDNPSTVSEFTALWQTQFMSARSEIFGTTPSEEFRGTFIIARSPASNAVHTVYSQDVVYNLKTECSPANSDAAAKFKHTITTPEERQLFTQNEAVNICVKSDEVNFIRAVRIAADGRNSSAISVINSDELENDEENPCL